MKRLVPTVFTAILLSSFILSQVSVSASPNIIYVPTNYATIQGAVDAANPGDTVFVYSGTYHESITIAKPISLIGESKESTTIIGPGTGDVVRISSDGVNISDFTVKGSGTNYISPFEGGDAGVKLSLCKNCTISNCISSENCLGIFLDSSENNEIKNNECYSNSKEGIYLRLSNNNTIKNNICNSNGGHGGIYLNPSNSYNLIEDNVCNLNLDHGIKLQKSSNNNIVKNNTCLNNGDGIFLLDVYFNTVIQNNCSSNVRPGIFLRLSENNVVANNTCRFNNEAGISLDFCNYNNTIENNVCSNNKESGIRLRLSSSQNNVINNTCTSNERQGIKIEYSDYNEISNNTLSKNRGGGIQVEPRYESQWNEFMETYKEEVEAKVAKGIKVEGENSAGNKINWNDIEGNNGVGCDVGVPTQVNATYNWWGDASGPYHPTLNPQGKGDRVSDNVLFEPWLDAQVHAVTEKPPAQPAIPGFPIEAIVTGILLSAGALIILGKKRGVPKYSESTMK